MKQLVRDAYTWEYTGERNVLETVDKDEEIELYFFKLNIVFNVLRYLMFSVFNVLRYWVSFCKIKILK